MLDILVSIGLGLLFYLVIVGLAHALERQRPAERHGVGDMPLNLKHLVLLTTSSVVSTSLFGGLALTAADLTGGGAKTYASTRFGSEPP